MVDGPHYWSSKYVSGPILDVEVWQGQALEMKETRNLIVEKTHVSRYSCLFGVYLRKLELGGSSNTESGENFVLEGGKKNPLGRNIEKTPPRDLSIFPQK